MKRIAILIHAVIFLLNTTPGFGEDDANEDSSSLFDFNKISNTFQGITKKAKISVTQFPNYLFHNDRTRANNTIKGVWKFLKKWCCCCFGCSNKEEEKEEKNRSSLKETDPVQPMDAIPKDATRLQSKEVLMDSVHSNDIDQEVTKSTLRNSEDHQQKDDPEIVWDDDSKVLQKITEMAADKKSTKTNEMYKNFQIIKKMCNQMNSFKFGTIETILTNLNNFKYLRKLEYNKNGKELPEITYEPFPEANMKELDALIEKVTKHKKMLTDKIEEEIQRQPQTKKRKKKPTSVVGETEN